jgi:diaminohydroxyphosphoribosylaminopyrimidine deaminase/5-amino-6-(5-phosphoribosylamino)uracil reductase
VALTQAGARARGATMYCTLEPCTHHGRTPPCAPALIEAGIGRVVVAAIDPNPIEQGNGVRALEAAGIEVATGVLEDDARALIAGFARWIVSGRPLVTLKLATSLDGRVAAADGSSRWVTGPTARRDVHRLRAWSDAVLVGIGTVLADDPALTCRLRGYSAPQPLRVVLDSSGRTPPAATVLDEAAPTVVFTTSKAPEDALEPLRARGAEVARLPAREGRIDPVAVLEELGRREIQDLLIEGGPTIAGEFVESALVDRYVFYVAPKLLGQVGPSAIAGLVVPNIADARELTISSIRRVGADLKIEARARHQ